MQRRDSRGRLSLHSSRPPLLSAMPGQLQLPWQQRPALTDRDNVIILTAHTPHPPTSCKLRFAEELGHLPAVGAASISRGMCVSACRQLQEQLDQALTAADEAQAARAAAVQEAAAAQQQAAAAERRGSCAGADVSAELSNVREELSRCASGGHREICLDCCCMNIASLEVD